MLTSWWILLSLHLNPAQVSRRVSHFLSEDPPSAGDKTFSLRREGALGRSYPDCLDDDMFHARTFLTYMQTPIQREEV